MKLGRQVCALSQATCCGLTVSSWSHSALRISDFLSPWQAIENASHLAWELGTSAFMPQAGDIVSNRPRQTGGISFDESIRIHFYHDEVSASTLMPHSALQGWIEKPWKLCADVSNLNQVSESVATFPHVIDLWCEEELCSDDIDDAPVEAIIGHRPNHEIQQDFDDLLPYAFRGIPGVIVAPPQWQDHPAYRIAQTNGVAVRDATGHLTIAFRSWIVRHGQEPVRFSRDFSLRPQLLVHLPDTARRIWNDYVSATAPLVVHIVRPTPHSEERVRMLHLIVEVSRPLRCGVQPVLIASRRITATDVGDPQWHPGLLPIQFGVEEVHQVCRLPCTTFQLLVPMAGRVRRWLSPNNFREAAPGMFLPVWWDLRLRPIETPTYDEDEEDHGMLQTHRKVHGISDTSVLRLQDDPTTVRSCLPEDGDQDRGGVQRLQPPHPPQVPDDIATSTFLQNRDILVAYGVDIQQPQDVDTFGLHVQHIGIRAVRLPDLTTQSIIGEIRRVWVDIPFPFTAILKGSGFL